MLGIFGPSQALAATYVTGLVPDWDQPYNYPPAPNPPPSQTGPGAPPPFTWDAWCAPTSGSNLLGHWEDVKGFAVADGAPDPLEGVATWGAPDWHDVNADLLRPGPTPGPPVSPTDLGWYMDTNNTGDTNLANSGHSGTFAKDTHTGLQSYLDQVLVGFWTGTRGNGFALGTARNGFTATAHVDIASAFIEIQLEIDDNRTILATFKHWNVADASAPAPAVISTDEDQHALHYYDWTFSGGTTDLWGNSETWGDPEGDDPKLTLGHVVTIIGYIEAGDLDDPGTPVNDVSPLPTDWIIVHDNAPGTQRNIAVPFNSTIFADWVGNTNVQHGSFVPTVSVTGMILLAGLVGAGALLLLRRTQMA